MTNPVSNSLGINEFTITAPTGWAIYGCDNLGPTYFLGDCDYGATAATFYGVSGTSFSGIGPIPPGNTEVFEILVAFPTGTTYPISGTFTTSFEMTDDNFYPGGSLTLNSWNPLVTDVTLTPSSSFTNPFIAGSSPISFTAQLVGVGAVPEAISGVPIAIEAEYFGGGGTISGSGITATSAAGVWIGYSNSAGQLTFSYTPDNVISDYTHTTTCETSQTCGYNYVYVIIGGTNYEGSYCHPTSCEDWESYDWYVVTGPAAPTEVTLGTNYDQPTYATSVVSSSTETTLTISLADKFGNAFTPPATFAATATLTAAEGSLVCTVSCASISVNDAGFVGGVEYAPMNPTTFAPLKYGTFDVVSATLQVSAPTSLVGTYVGASKSLMIGDLAGAPSSVTGYIYDVPYAGSVPPPDSLTENVEAGTPVELTVAFGVPSGPGGLFASSYAGEQAGVPVNMTLTTNPSSLGTYTGTFSNGLKWIVVDSNSAGIASKNFTADTISGYSADAAMLVTEPTTTLTTRTVSYTPMPYVFTTGSTSPASLKIQSYSYSGTGTCPSTSATTYVEVAGYSCLDVLLGDKYKNSVNWEGSFSLQVGISVSSGALSATTIYILTGDHDTYGSNWPVEFTAPTTTGSVTVTASTPQSGISSATLPLSIVSLSPIVSLTPPVTATFSVSSVTINATAIPSPAAPLGTVVVSFEYSLNGAANVTAPLTKTNSTGAGFASFPVTLVSGVNTIKIYATDSNSKTGGATFTFTYTVVPPGKQFTSTGATQNTQNGFTGDQVPFTNQLGASTVNALFVWYNSADQVVAVSAQLNVAFTAGQTQTFFNAGTTTPGTYTVQAFIRDTSNNAVSIQYAATVTVP